MPDLPGTPGPDVIDGTDDADSITGGAGDDTLIGYGGDDTILGGTGDDLIYGDEGNDSLDGGEGSDNVDAAEGADLLVWDGSAAGGDHDVYVGGDGHVPVFTGNYVTGMTGSENYTFDPYNHNGGDSLHLNLGSDSSLTLTYTSTEAGQATDANGNTIDFSGVERVFLGDGNNTVDASGATLLYQDGPSHFVGMRLYSGNGDDVITGSAGTDYIQSGGGDDLVHGGDGNDVIETGAGDDIAYGGLGDDGYRWGNGNSDAQIGNDFYDGESGYNTLNAWQSAPGAGGQAEIGTSVVLDTDRSGDIVAEDAGGNEIGTLRFENFENLRTGGGNDTIDGSAAGVDGYRVFADWGNDSIIGSHGNDTLEGGWGGDTIIGGLGNDAISMNGDIFAGQSRPDASVDTLVLQNDFGQDTIRGFGFGGEPDSDGNPAPADRIDVGNLQDADGNPITVGDTEVRADTDEFHNNYAVVSFPNGEELWFRDVDVATLTPQRLMAMGIPCFCRGTMILTPRGEIAVEELQVGDLVVTRDNGLRPIRWIGGRALDQVDLAISPKLRPIRINAGALGQGLPAADLTVSPQHRILLRSTIAQRMFGAAEVLVAARQLTALDGIAQIDVSAVEYFHILFDQHEIIISNGAETESLFTGPEAMKSLGQEARDEIFTLFPELRDTPAEPARPFIPGGKARQLVQRHQRNGKHLVRH